MKHVGNQIETLLKERRLKYKDVAEELGMSAVNLSKILKKKSIDSALLYRFAAYFQVPVSCFYEENQNSSRVGVDTRSGGRLQTETIPKENELLKALVDTQQKTIHAHEMTIAALQDSIELLKQGKGRSMGQN